MTDGWVNYRSWIDRVVDEVLKGIDKVECDDENGWWDTSTGAKFGAERKAALKEALLNGLYEETG